MSDGDSGSGGSGKVRRRRFGKSTSFRSPRPPRYIPDAADSSTVQLNNLQIESIKFLSDCNRVSHVISSFDSVKRDLVQSIGFGGLLSLPCIRTENKSFSYWLLSHLKWYTTCLTVGDKISLTLNPEHVGKISGLSTCGTIISDKFIASADDKINFIRSNLSFLTAEVGILESAEQFLLQDLPDSMNKQECDKFKIAFVIFVVGRFLGPSSEHCDGSTNFWEALQNPDSISSYNWSAFVYANIKKAARLVRWSTPRNEALTTVIGCTLILQIFYLDNIDFGDLNLPHDLLPRWNHYSDDFINTLVAADRITPLNPYSTTEYGRMQVQREGSLCYIFTKDDLLEIQSSDLVLAEQSKGRGHSRSSRDNSSTPDHSDDDTRYHLPLASASCANSIQALNVDQEVLDFNSFLGNKYQGQVDSALLEDIKLHNARCLSHLSNSYQLLAAAIVKENANIASKVLEKRMNVGAVPPRVPSNSHFHHRRRTHNELQSGTDSSTDGEDTTLRKKMPRSILPLSSPTPSSSRAKTIFGTPPIDMTLPPFSSNLINSSPLLPKNNYLGGSPSYLANPSPSSTDLITPHDGRAIQLPSSAHHMTALAGYSPSYLANASQSSDSPEIIIRPAALNLADFATPEATLKMAHFTAGLYTPSEETNSAGWPMPLRMVDSLNGIALNGETPADDPMLSVGTKKTAHPGPLCRSHFSMSLSYPEGDPLSVDKFYHWLSQTNDEELERIWVLHNTPRPLRILGNDLKDQFVSNKTMSSDVFDASIRRLIQIDSSIYASDEPTRWRHLLESDFALNAIGHAHENAGKAVRDQFVGPAVDYEILRCQMIYIPYFFSGSWRCYAWDLHTSTLFIMDPTASSRKDDVVISRHLGIFQNLCNSLSETIKDLFNGWAPNQLPSKYAVVRIAGMPYSRKVSGLITLFCIWYFDGSSVTVPANTTTIYKFKAHLLDQLLQINSNIGCLPSTFMQSSI